MVLFLNVFTPKNIEMLFLFVLFYKIKFLMPQGHNKFDTHGHSWNITYIPLNGIMVSKRWQNEIHT